jgi:hypothetical protein
MRAVVVTVTAATVMIIAAATTSAIRTNGDGIPAAPIRMSSLLLMNLPLRKVTSPVRNRTANRNRTGNRRNLSQK